MTDAFKRTAEGLSTQFAVYDMQDGPATLVEAVQGALGAAVGAARM